MITSCNMKIAFFAGILLLSNFLKAQNDICILSDPLNSEEIVKGEEDKISIDGKFTANGWQSISPKGMLKIVLQEDAGKNGRLEIKISNIDWEKANNASGKNKKIHFLNMFSNENGDHHFEDGGTASDALWTLRTGSDEHGKSRYGSVFKFLWSSCGAKRAPGNLYHEKRNRGLNWEWDKNKTYTLSVEWNSHEEKIYVSVDDTLFYERDWKGQNSPLRYVFMGKAGDFHSWTGPVFSDLKIFAVK